MNVKKLIPLGAAAVLGLGAVLAQRLLGPNEAVSAPPATRDLVVSARAIAPGSRLVEGDLAVKPVAPDQLPTGASTEPAKLLQRVTLTPIAPGQAIVETMLRPAGHAAGLAGQIPPGMRAVTLEVNEFTGVGGMITPGSRVDLLVMVQPDSGPTVSRTIAQSLYVTAVGRRTGADPADPLDRLPRSVTITCTPEQAELVHLAANRGALRLALRGEGDDAVAAVRGTSSEVFEPTLAAAPIPEPPQAIASLEPVAPPPPAPTRAVTVIRGGEISQVQFALPAGGGHAVLPVDSQP